MISTCCTGTPNGTPTPIGTPTGTPLSMGLPAPLLLAASTFGLPVPNTAYTGFLSGSMAMVVVVGRVVGGGGGGDGDGGGTR